MLRALGVVVPQARAIEKKWRKMEFGTRFGMAPEFSGVVSHSREALARTMECGDSRVEPINEEEEKASEKEGGSGCCNIFLQMFSVKGVFGCRCCNILLKGD
ncbi:hypothetical protein Tco_1549655 [Tanacetum coccineum]